ncbi:MAG: heme ABC exporter ATP-binding protein CcmA [Anaerolineae bacterium]|nr:heme ABC exporter ATP-binding protein CcmA [Anaerolineae bacterium]
MTALIEVQGLTKVYDILPVLRKLDLTVERGEFVALLGPNGSGKSTLLRLLCGLSRPTGGSIRVGGWELPGEASAVRAQIGMVSHQSLLYENLTARENLRFYGRLYDMTDFESRIDDLLEQVGLAKRGDSLVRTFSRGMQQRLSIARALLHNPDVLLMDEPYTGLDVDAAVTLDSLLRDAHAGGRTIIMTTHQLDRAALIASRVVILSRGAIGYDAPAQATDGPGLAAHYSQITSMATAR